MKTVPVSADIKARLDEVRPRGMSYDQLLRGILDTRPLDEWREVLDAGPSRDVAMVLSRLAQLAGAPSTRREPSEQILLAESAAQRWQLWQEAGRLRVQADRKWSYRTQSEAAPRVRIRRVR